MNKLHVFGQIIKRNEYMLEQFYSSLQNRLSRLLMNGSVTKEIAEQLQKQLSSARKSWTKAYQIELALIEYMDDVAIETEWQRRLAETHVLKNNLSQYYKENAAETDINRLRYLLGRLLADIHWAKESRRVIRLNERKMRGKIIFMFIVAFILYFVPTISRYLLDTEFTSLRLYYIYTAASAGFLGATFSQIASIQSRIQEASLEQVRAMGNIGYITARSLVGAGAGLIMFYLLQSDLLSGSFFPEFIQEAAQIDGFKENLISSPQSTSATVGVSQNIEVDLAVGTLAKPTQGLSLLIIWCLIAGFSEKLIPGILNNKAKKLQEESK